MNSRLGPHVGTHLLVANCEAGHAVGSYVVATVGPNALLSLWRA
jgi:hypothetical protein